MYNAFFHFQRNISRVRDISTIYLTLNQSSIRQNINIDDLLRTQIVYSVSALDKLVHDLIKIGLKKAYFDGTLRINVLLKDNISFKNFFDMMEVLQSSSLNQTDKEMYISDRLNEIFTTKLSYLSFQAKDKIIDGLSYIWSPIITNTQGRDIGLNKWKLIVEEMINLDSKYTGRTEDSIATELALIVERRNAIAHEADMVIDLGIYELQSITFDEVQNAIRFIEILGTAIFNKIK